MLAFSRWRIDWLIVQCVISGLISSAIFVLFRLESVPKNSISALPVNPHPVPSRAPTDLPSVSVTKQLQMVPRGSQLYNTQQADMFYQDPRGTAPPFDPAPYQQGKFKTKLSIFHLHTDFTLSSHSLVFLSLQVGVLPVMWIVGTNVVMT